MKRNASCLLAVCVLARVGVSDDVQTATATRPQEVEIALDVSFSDWPCEPPASVKNDKARLKRWLEQTWGERGLVMTMDTVLAAGV